MLLRPISNHLTSVLLNLSYSSRESLIHPRLPSDHHRTDGCLAPKASAFATEVLWMPNDNGHLLSIVPTDATVIPGCAILAELSQPGRSFAATCNRNTHLVIGSLNSHVRICVCHSEAPILLSGTHPCGRPPTPFFSNRNSGHDGTIRWWTAAVAAVKLALSAHSLSDQPLRRGYDFLGGRIG
jgi:hypothetical protein